MSDVNLDLIINYLDGLGNTPYEVAESLLDKGMLGERQDCTNCPLANGIRSLLDPGVEVIVGPGMITLKLLEIYSWTYRQVRTGRVIDEFIYNFDNGLYPGLEVIDQ